MCNTVIFNQTLNDAVTKVSAPITNDGMQSSKTTRDIVQDKLFDHFSIIIPIWDCFNPFGHVIDSNEDIMKTKARGKTAKISAGKLRP